MALPAASPALQRLPSAGLTKSQFTQRVFSGSFDESEFVEYMFRLSKAPADEAHLIYSGIFSVFSKYRSLVNLAGQIGGETEVAAVATKIDESFRALMSTPDVEFRLLLSPDDEIEIEVDEPSSGLVDVFDAAGLPTPTTAAAATAAAAAADPAAAVEPASATDEPATDESATEPAAEAVDAVAPTRPAPRKSVPAVAPLKTDDASRIVSRSSAAAGGPATPASPGASLFSPRSQRTVHPVRDPYGNVIGQLLHPRELSAMDQEIVSNVASLSGQLIPKVEHYQDHLRRSQALAELIRSVSQLSHFDDLLDNVIVLAKRTLHCDVVSVWMKDDKNYLWTRKSKDLLGVKVPIGQGIAGRVAQTGDLLNAKDAYECDFFNQEFDKKTGYRTRSILCVPIKRNENIVGVIQVINKRCRLCRSNACSRHGVFFDGDDEDLLRAFAHECGLKLLHAAFSDAMDRAIQHVTDERDASFLSQYLNERQKRAALTRRRKLPEAPPAHTREPSRIERQAENIHQRDVGFPDGWPRLLPSDHDDSADPDRPIMAASGSLFIPCHVPEAELSYIEESMDDWDFDYLGLREESLLMCAFRIFEKTDLVRHFSLPANKLRNFLLDVRANYNPLHWHPDSDRNRRRSVTARGVTVTPAPDAPESSGIGPNPYHNWIHGFGVLHNAYLQLVHGRAREVLHHHEQLALLVAAITHDVQHPGKNNQFLVNSEHRLALRYNDESVLENHHAATAFRLLSRSRNSFLDPFFQDPTFNALRRRIRMLVISAILSTDMTRHNDMVAKLQARAAERDTTASSDSWDVFRRTEPTDSKQLVDLIVHAADLSNPLLPLNMYQEWVKRVVAEFNTQTRLEKQLDLPYQDFMAHADPLSVAKLQTNFIKFIISPLWNTLGDCFGFDTPLRHLKANRQHYLDSLERLEAEAAAGAGAGAGLVVSIEQSSSAAAGADAEGESAGAAHVELESLGAPSAEAAAAAKAKRMLEARRRREAAEVDSDGDRDSLLSDSEAESVGLEGPHAA